MNENELAISFAGHLRNGRTPSGAIFDLQNHTFRWVFDEGDDITLEIDDATEDEIENAISHLNGWAAAHDLDRPRIQRIRATRH